MKSNLRAWLGAFALLLMVSVATLTFAFKADGKKDIDKSATKKAAEWYTISQIVVNSDFTPSNLKISSAEVSEPTGDDCNLSNEGNPCSVLLDNTTSATISFNTPLTSLPSGVSVDDFARQPEN